MNDKDRVALEKIYMHISHVIEYCDDCSDLENFEADTMRVEATVFNFLQIGEIAKVKLSDEAKAEMADIPWNMIYGMRNRIVHGYDGVDMSIVWDTIQEDFPKLKSQIEKYLSGK